MISKKRKPKIRSGQLIRPIEEISGELIFIKGKYTATFYSTDQSKNEVSKIKGKINSKNYSGTSGTVTQGFSDSYVGSQNSKSGEGGNSPSSPSPIYWTLIQF